MNKSIRIFYLLIFLISGVLVTQAQVTLPEQVCVGSTQHYWVNGLAGSVYTWRVNGVVQNSTSNEINIQWSNVGIFTLEVQEHQGTCDGDIQTGLVTVTDLAIPEFTVATAYCAGALIAALPTVSNNGINGTWTPGINNTQTTTYTFTPDDSQCATQTSLTISINDQDIPLFAQVGPYCRGENIPALPTVSINGITGSWNATIDNTQTATYIFTPNAGQCAETASMTITINNPVIPTFEAIAPVCSGTPVSLPAASLEGITGSWSPAINNMATTTYTFTPDASYSCASTATLTVTITDQVMPTFAQAGPYCTGAIIPALPATSINGVTGTWSPAIDNTQTATYTFTPDANQCASTASMTITINNQITPTFAQVGTYCAGASIEALPTTSTNGITGSWSPAIDNTRTTTYTFTPDANQCAVPVELTIPITDGILPTFEAVAAICSGSPAISLPTTSLNNITGSWSPAFNNLATTEYTFTPDNGQCATTTTLTVIVNDKTIPLFDPAGSYCAGSVVASLPTISTNGIRGTWLPAIDNTRTTTYTFTPDEGQCATTITQTIIINDQVTPSFAPMAAVCSGATITLPEASLEGITGTWSPAVNNTATTTYTFTPDANYQCAATAELTITILDGATPIFAPVGPYCAGTVIPALPATSTNGINGSWSPAIDNTQTTTYTFTPDANQCAVPITLTITISDEITPMFAQVGPYCSGASIPALPGTSTNNITGTWSPAINNTQTTEYTFTPDAGQCGTTATMTININDEITPTFAQIGPYCAGSTIEALPTTSTNGIIGSWSPAIDNTRTTTYTFTPDAGQCGTTTTMTITISDEIIPIFAQVGPYCAGSAIPDLPTTSTNGITGSWSPSIDNTRTNTYTFTPDAGQCGTIATLTININDEITPTFVQVGPYCAGTAIPTLPTVSTNGITGIWSPAINNSQTTEYTFTPDAGQCGTTATMTITISDEITPIFAQVGPYCAGIAIPDLPNTSINGITGLWSPLTDNTRTTTYTFTPDAGQCGQITTMTITISEEIIPTFAQVQSYCFGNTIPVLPTTSTNGITGSWSPAIDNTQTATYTFTPDAGQCGATATLTINIDPQVTPTFTQVGPYCAGTAIAALPATSLNGITGTWSPAIDNTRTFTYTFTPDAGQCGSTTTMTITISDEITPTFAQMGPYCVGFAIPDLPTTSTNGITGTWSPALDNTQTATYTFTPDAGQCGSTTTMTITISDEITPTFAQVGPYCAGSTIPDLPTTSNNGITGIWSPSIDNRQTTQYTFTPDAGQCGTIATMTITISDEITPTFAQIGPYCAGSIIDALPTTSTNGITGAWSPALDNTRTTEYTFTPDAGQCGTTATMTITISDEITPIFAQVGPYCAGFAIPDLPNTSINGITGSWSPAIDNTRTATYTFTPDGGQCGTTNTMTITISDEITPTFAQVGPYCAGFAIPELPTTSTNGISGSWSPAIDNTRTATYTFTPDAGECGATATMTVTISDEITPTFAQVGPYCFGTTVPLLPTTSDNGITGSWSPVIDNTRTTTYTFTPDAGQCGTTATLTIVINEEVVPVFNPVGPFNSGSVIAALPITSTNGISGSWSPAIDNTRTATYTFTPDPGQCAVPTTLTIEINGEIVPLFDPIGPLCSGSAIAALPVTSTNGIAGSWSPAIDNTRTTTYTFTPDVGQGAVTATLTIEITNGIIPVFDAVGPLCSGATFSLPATSNNGVTGTWSPAIDNTRTTTYTFTPNDGQCGTSITLTVSISDEIIPVFAAVGPYCAGAAIADLPTVSSNGITGTWSPAIDNQQTTTYTFIPDAGQCGVPATLTIDISDGITPLFDPIGPLCAGSAIILPVRSNNGITGSWSPAIDNTRTMEYTFTPDAGQCGIPTTLTVEISNEIVPTFDIVDSYCAGATIVALPTISANGISGTWSPAINNTQTTEYTFTPDAGQCGVPTTVTITISNEVIPTFDAVGPACAGTSIGALPTTSNNGVRGTWSPDIDNTRTTTYTFTPEEGQCAVPAALTVEITNGVIPVFDAAGPYCPGDAIAELPSVSNNGIRGSWSPAINNQLTTTYTFTPDGGQCAVPTTLTIAINPGVIPVFDPVGTYCPGAAIATLPSVSNNGIRGSWSPEINNTRTTTYTFTPDRGQCAVSTTLTIVIEQGTVPAFNPVANYCPGAAIAALPTTSNNGIHGSWSPEIDNTQTTTYTFTPDPGQCATTATLTIVIDQSIIPTFDAMGPYCPGGNVPNLPTTSNNGISGSWSPAIDNTRTTTYTFTPDGGQCATTATLTIVMEGTIVPEFNGIAPICSGEEFSLPSTSNNGISGSWSPAINNTQTTTYTFTPDGGQCGTTATLTVEVNRRTIPVFDPSGPYCPGDAIAELSSVSNNGIRGSWSPAINNRQTTTYTFTPDAGQCAGSTTLTIVINQGVLPTFDLVGPYCQGDAVPGLPSVSNNGIRGSWSPAIDNTQSGTYTFTPDDGQCASPTLLSVVIEPRIVPVFDPVGPYCPGSDIPALPVVSNNGIHGSWSPAIDNTQTTTYTFSADEGLCPASATLTIVIDQNVTPLFNPVGPFCPGTEIALPMVSANGISGSWSPAIDNTQTTTYTFTPDAGQCGSPVNLTVEITDQINPSFDAIAPVCSGSPITLPVASREGIAGTWSPQIDNTQTTTYTFTPAGGACANTATLTVEVLESVTPEFSAVGPYCPGADIAELPRVSNNNIRGSWSPAINNMATTTYIFIPEDGQCARITTLTIEIQESITPTFDPMGTYCRGASIASLPTVSREGIRGSWSPGINNQQSTTYTFIPENGQCATVATLTILITDQLVPEFNEVGTYCPGAAIAALPTTSNNGISGSWSPSINNRQTTTYTFTPDEGQCAAPAMLTINVDANIVPEFDALAPICSGGIVRLPGVSNNGISGSWSPAINNTQTTTYTFTPDEGQCATTASLTAEVRQSVIPTFDPVGPYCPGAAIAALPTTSNNGISGSWSPEIDNTRTTTYIFTPDNGQCVSQAYLTIVIDQSILPTFASVGPYCPGENIPALPSVSDNGISGSWAPAINNQLTTTYTFTPDAGQCGTVTTLTISINQNNLPTFASVGPYCPGENIPALPTVSANGIRGSWSPAINNEQTTSYTFTPDPGQCSSPTTLTIVINPPVLPTFASVGPYCSGSAIAALPTVSTNGISGSWAPAINNSQTTTYTFTPDAGQCAQVATLIININEETTPAFTQMGPYCAGSVIPALPTISNNGIRGSWSPAINNSQTTTYTFTPNAGQCGAAVTMTIEISNEITPLFDSMGPYCRGASFTLPAVSTNDIRGSWTPAINSQQTTTYTFTSNSGQCGALTTLTVEISDQITPLFDPMGPYCRGANIAALPTVSTNGIRGTWRPAINNTQTTTYTFTPDAGQCGSSTTLTIVISDEITPTFTAVGPYCAGATIEALPRVSTNGITGSWSPAINNQQTTTYTFTPDPEQCGRITTLTININNELTPLFSPSGPYCAGGAIPALPTISNNGIRGSWSPEIDNTQTTTYTFTPDNGQCAVSSSMTITVSDQITPTFNSPVSYCMGSAIAALPTISNNGIRGSWSPAINNQQTTTYTFTPNAGQCGTTASLTIEITDQIIPTFDPVGPYTVGSAIPALPTISNNGIRGSWSPAINNRQTTTYTFTPNAGQCAVATTLTIDITDLIVPAFDPVGPYCAGSAIAALPTISNNGIRGSWSPAINNTRTTTYTFTPEAGQSAGTARLTITIQNEVRPVFAAVGPYCAGAAIAELPITSTNGISGTWSPAINNQQTTTYTFTPDEGQCGNTTTLTIVISDEITPTFAQVGPYCVGSVIAALPTISNNGIRGSWSPAIDNTRSTTYTFTPNAGQCAVATTLTIDITDQVVPAFAALGPYTAGSAIPALPTVSSNGIRGSWSPAINNRQTTTYTFTPNAGQCAVSATLTIDITDLVVPTFDPAGPYCAGTAIAVLPTLSNNGIRGSWSPAINNQQTTTYTFTPDAGQSAGIARLTITIQNEVRPTFTAVAPHCAGSDIAALPTVSNNGIRGSWSPAINNQQTTTYTFTSEDGQCATTADLTISISDEITPTFAPVGPYCAGSIIAALPTVSSNGVRGNWSPAIDNIQTTTYTFTPDAGQCVVSTSLTVEITDPITPVFDPAGPYTAGSVIPALPIVSNNGIRGSWSPAINNQQSTTYTFTPNAGQCAVPATLTIDITDLVVPTFDPVGPYCAGSVITALPTVSNNGIRGSWSPAINNRQTTTYTFTPDAGQSAGIARLTITIQNELRPTFDPAGPYCASSSIDALPTVSNNGIRGSWSPSINNQQTTTYTFTPEDGQCATTADLTITILNEIEPSFTPVVAYCAGSSIAALPTVSNNGIRGSWSPSINNQQTTTYIFTPEDGQCAATADLTIIINPAVTPEFTPVGPFCPGALIAALPTVSNNGIRGSWAPAINNTRTTTYTFTPAAGQCAEPVAMTIEISDAIVPTFNAVGPFCPGTVIAELPVVSTNGIRGRWRPAINNRQTTTYTFTPDAGECGISTTMTIAIEENAAPVFDPVGPYCAGSDVAALPTVSNNGIRGTWSPAINNNRTTTYTFTPDAGQCGTTANLTILITDPIIPVFDRVGPYCAGSAIAPLPVVSNNGIQGTWSPAINNEQTTTYTFTPDAGQCATSASLWIVIDHRTVPTFDQVASYCRGSAIGGLRTVSNNGIRGSWRPAINNQQTTTYTFTPDQGQCVEPTTMTIEITDEAEPTFNPVGPYPRGAAIAALHTVSNNGIRGSWRPAINNQQTTTYTFTPDPGQCSRPFRMVIAITDEIIPVFDPVGAFCPGSEIAALPTVSNNGIRGSWSPAINNEQTTTYTFTPDPGQSAAIATMTITIAETTIPTFDPVGTFCPGSAIAALPIVSNNGIRGSWSPAINNQQTTTYTFTPDPGQCAASTSMTIDIADNIQPVFDPVNPYCPGSAIAALPTVSNNGIRGSWSPAINNQQTTTYIFIPDAGQCALSASLTIEIGTDILPDFDLIGPFCPGTPIESLPVVSKNGIRGSWSPVINNMVTTNYLFTPFEGQCALSTSLTCEIGSEITPVFNQAGPYCYGSAIAALPTTSINGVSGTWSPAINNQQTTTYTFTPTPGRCALTSEMTITILEPIIPTFTPVRSYCAGSMIEALPATSLNGITGSWSPAINNQQTTLYTFTPDAGQCAVNIEMTITITNETVPVFTAMNSYCEGAHIPALPAVSSNGIRGSWSPAINNGQTTTYTFTPDAGQCATSASMVITIDKKVTPTFTPVASYCPGSVIPELPRVSNNGIHGSWTPAINNRQSTTYTFTPDAGQCAGTADLTIEINENIVPVFAQPDLYCAGAIIADLPRTSINHITGSWSPAINNQQTTTYTFTPDAGQCATTTEMILFINPEPAMPVANIVQPDCNHISATIEVVSPRGSNYQFRLDGGNYQNETLFSGLAPGSNHTIQVKDMLTGCESKIASITVNSLPQPPATPLAIVVVNPKCDGGGVIRVRDPIGADYEYQMDGNIYQSQATFNNVAPGEHLIRVRNKTNGCESSPSRLFIQGVAQDMDFDGIADAQDADVDGDGILNVNEGGLTTDTDGDGLLNYMDIDADGDGIVDNIEAQSTAHYIPPSHQDRDNNGLDDAYDKDQGGTEIIPVDSDKDGIPDFMDLDSDNDLVPDFIEGNDENSNGKPDHYALNKDSDHDGLDDGYDNIVNACGAIDNALGSNAPIQDFDGDGIPDWRDENDDDDEYLTRYEDLNGDGDFSNDDIDFDGYPEYLDYGRDCDLFIPDAFSPNGDNVHDFYQIYCINHYPDATIYIFDQLGNKIYEKRHYGNIEFWKTPSAAWWDGRPTRGAGYSRNDLVPPGTYYYVLDLGNGQVKKSYVFVSY